MTFLKMTFVTFSKSYIWSKNNTHAMTLA